MTLYRFFTGQKKADRQKFKFDKSQLEHLTENFSIEEIELLRSKKIYISGGTGFVGQWIVFTIFNLLEDGKSPEITIISRDTKKANSIFSQKKSLMAMTWKEMLSLQSFENRDEGVIAIHAAVPAASGVNISGEDVSAFGNNTSEFINKFTKLGKSATFVNLSSGGVYDRPSSGLITEDLTRKNFDSSTNYEKIKINDELILENSVRNNNIKGANPRLFSFCGPGLEIPGTFALAEFIHLAKNGKSIELTGNPNSLRSYMSPLDMAIWIIKCAIYPTLDTLHIGSSEVLNMQEIAELVAHKFGGEVVIHEEAKKQPILNYVPETKNTVVHLNVKKPIDFVSALNYWVDTF